MDFAITNDLASFYIHWPFCPYKCHFCPFVALASHDQYMGQYHDALCKELRDFGAQCATKPEINTVFLGGGTPSTWPEHLLLDMFGTLYNIAQFSEGTEITIEVNPGTVTPARLACWREAGINRLSIGVQSLKDDVLKKLNRHQTAADVENLMVLAQPLFTNISVDLIIGLPGVTDTDWRALLRRVVEWPINHLSMYFLTVHEDTPLYFGVKTKKITLPPEESVVDLYQESVEFVKQYGFEQYEISNFARNGHESRHNTIYWQRKPYKGFGLGACSFDGMRRFQNEKNLMNYCTKINNGDTLHMFNEQLTPQQIRLEKLMLGLRQRRGAVIADLTENLTEEQKNNFFNKISELTTVGLIKTDGERLVLTTHGLAIENEVVLKLS